MVDVAAHLNRACDWERFCRAGSVTVFSLRTHWFWESCNRRSASQLVGCDRGYHPLNPLNHGYREHLERDSRALVQDPSRSYNGTDLRISEGGQKDWHLPTYGPAVGGYSHIPVHGPRYPLRRLHGMSY